MPEARKIVTRRYAEIDMIKVIGIFGVILIHCLRPVWSPHASPMEHFLNQELRFAVPGFLFCSGFLYANSSSFDWSETRSRLGRILIPYFVASAGAEIWRLVDDRPRNATEIVADFLLGSAFGHYYYIFVIVGLVLVTPFFGRMSRPVLIGITVFVSVFQFASIALESIMGIEMIDVIPRFWLVRLPLLWWNFFLLGWLLQQDYVRWQSFVLKARARMAGVLFLLCVAFSSAQVLDVPLFVAQVSSWLQIVVILFLIATLFCGRGEMPTLVRQISEATFAIYLFHIFFVVWIQPLVPHATGSLDPVVVVVQILAGVLGSLALIGGGRIVFRHHSRTILGA